MFKFFEIKMLIMYYKIHIHFDILLLLLFSFYNEHDGNILIRLVNDRVNEILKIVQ